jgi:hypothetical protein
MVDTAKAREHKAFAKWAQTRSVVNIGFCKMGIVKRIEVKFCKMDVA